MFRSVRIQNFRQFKDLELKNLGRINLITGQNNTGKTSLLEALFLAAGPTNPESIVTLAQLRGIDRSTATGVYAWGFVFRDGAGDQTITIRSERDDVVREELTIGLTSHLEAPAGETNGHRDSGVISTSDPAVPALEFRYIKSDGESTSTGVSQILISDRGRTTHHAKGFDQKPLYFFAPGPAHAEADAERFSRIVALRRKSEVIDAMRTVEPRLADLLVLSLGPPTVAADLGAGALVPVSFMGRGFERLLTLILGLLSATEGTLIIDEIDDGLHYSVMADVWKAIIAAAHQHDVQVFATTHSLEAIEAAVEGSKGYEGSLAFYRLERRDGNIEVIMGEDSRLRSAVSLNFELR
jgi:energy-coupling factor transporter ATP-binding protein EcfA2